jgi:DNA-binding transcriptional LysR family regulator
MSSIRTLRTFLVVARRGSFAAAGQEIGLTAAAVGQQIRALEQDVHQVLFDRGGRSIVLNTAGRALVGPVEELVARYQSIAGAARDDGGLSGSVVVGALVSALMGEFADALWAIKREHPRLEVRLFAGLSSDFALRVGRGELDAAVVTQPRVRLAPHLLWTHLYSEPMVLVVPRRAHFELPAQPTEILRARPSSASTATPGPAPWSTRRSRSAGSACATRWSSTRWRRSSPWCARASACRSCRSCATSTGRAIARCASCACRA